MVSSQTNQTTVGEEAVTGVDEMRHFKVCKTDTQRNVNVGPL